MAPLRTVHPLLAAATWLLTNVSAAAQRVGDLPPVAWVWGAGAAVLSLLGHDLFSGIFLLLVVATALDHSWGVRVVRETRPHEYSASRKRAGRDQKIITLCLMILLRAVEAWAARYDLLDVAAILRFFGAERLVGEAALRGGILSALVCAGVVVDELRSIHEHRVALGGKPIRALVVLFGGADKIQRALQGRGKFVMEPPAGSETRDPTSDA